MIEIIATEEKLNDYCWKYKVNTNRPCTIKEFIEAVIDKYPDKWGHIVLCHDNPNSPTIEYRYGKLKTNSCSEEQLSFIIKDALAYGGWGNMDFYITVFPTEDKPYQFD